MTIQQFAQLVTKETKESYNKGAPKGYPGQEKNWEVRVKPGKKYIKVDVGRGTSVTLVLTLSMPG